MERLRVERSSLFKRQLVQPLARGRGLPLRLALATGRKPAVVAE